MSYAKQLKIVRINRPSSKHRRKYIQLLLDIYESAYWYETYQPLNTYLSHKQIKRCAKILIQCDIAIWFNKENHQWYCALKDEQDRWFAMQMALIERQRQAIA